MLKSYKTFNALLNINFDMLSGLGKLMTRNEKNRQKLNHITLGQVGTLINIKVQYVSVHANG